ncbi:MAG: di-heme oxidoredictase family protein [Candidatus Sericytochromatia bacterium]
MWRRTLLLGALLLSACQVGGGVAEVPTALTSAAPARFRVADSSVEAFSHRFPDMNPESRTRFFSGESLFDQNWVTAVSSTAARDGLGPFFNARACASCHFKDGRSRPFRPDGQPEEALLVRLSNAQDQPDPVYGSQLQPFALEALPGEGQLQIVHTELPGRFADGTPYALQRPDYRLVTPGYGAFAPDLKLSVRQSPQLIGLGLLERLPEAEILAAADPDDRNGDGISGRPNRVRDVPSGATVLGRFGWKANQPTVEQQVAAAFAGDIGITSSLFPEREESALQALQAQPFPDGGAPELPDRLLERVVFYVQNLAVPAPRASDSAWVQAGERLFHGSQCAACHQPRYRVDGEEIAPYSDLLLHDMGPELADGRPDALASGQEWRTPPLWGVGLIPTVNGHSRYLHDGRARNLSEAILWHGGEATRARETFRQLSAAERDQLIAFLESL